MLPDKNRSLNLLDELPKLILFVVAGTISQSRDSSMSQIFVLNEGPKVITPVVELYDIPLAADNDDLAHATVKY